MPLTHTSYADRTSVYTTKDQRSRTLKLLPVSFLCYICWSQREISFQLPNGDQFKSAPYNIGIKHAFPCINVCQVPREMLKTEAVGRGFQHLPRDLANVNVLENHV